MHPSLKNIFAVALAGVLVLEPLALSGARVAYAEEPEAAVSAASSTPAAEGTDNEDIAVASSTPADAAASSTPDLPDIELTGTTTQAATSTAAAEDAPTSDTASSTPDTPLPPAAPDEPAAASSTQATSTSETATSSGPVIESGTAVALANILNIVNTNLVNSSGNALMLNYVDPVTGTIDLRALGSASSTGAACALFACAGTDGVSVNLEGEGDIHNAVVLNATSGGNLIENAGDAVIATGDAYAGLNLINLANTNIVDSDYLLVTMNAFQGVDGDIVFPSLSNFLSSLANNLAPGVFTSAGSADIQNDVNADAESGGNEVSGTASSTVQTGESASRGSVFNQINTDMLGGSTVSILFRVQGDWAGEVFGAPEGLQWTHGPDGTIALFDAGGSGSGTQSMTQVSASSTANIDNQVDVLALTGQNKVDAAHSTLITTGDALASANVMNIANTNVVGKNWIMAIINIFGDFTGNIAFGRPDLWVGEQVSVPSDVGDGDTVTYTYTVINNGDSPATDVTLIDDYDQDHIRVGDSSSAHAADSDGNTVWELGTIPPGGAVEVSYEGTVFDAPPGTDITNTVTVTEHETDANDDDNTDTATVSVPHPQSHHHDDEDDGEDTAPGDDDGNGAAAFAYLSVERAAETVTSDGSAPVHQGLTIVNDYGTASVPIVVHDVLSAPDGTLAHEEVWDVGSISSGEGVALAYDLSFGADAPHGTYMLSTVVYDEAGNRLGTFAGNGRVILIGDEPDAGQTGEALESMTRSGSDGSSDAGSVLGAVFPGVAVAHAAEAGDQAAAAGLLSLSWPYLLGIALLLLALLLFLAARRREDRRA